MKCHEVLIPRCGFCIQTVALWVMLCLSTCACQSLGSNGTSTSRDESTFFLNDQAIKEDDSTKFGCIDWEGKHVPDGDMYVPNRDDLCTRCTCKNRFSVRCHSVACSPPLDCGNIRLVSGVCCEHECLDNKGNNGTKAGKTPPLDNKESITNLSLRLVASTVTSLLFLALLLFMVHRLRQRRMLLAMRRFQARSGEICIHDDMDSDPNIPDNFMSLECPPYTDPPPPYSPPKPPHILPGEQPPPYEEISLSESRLDLGTGQGGNSGGGESNTTSAVQSQRTSRGGRHSENRSSVCQTYSSQHPAFGVEVEMPRYPTTTPSSQDALPRHDDILPAYASTDVVFPNITFSTMITPPHSQSDNLANSGTAAITADSAGSYVTTSPGMPTLTAFQKFSSLFKRSSKWKGRERSPSPQTLYQCNPPHYATLSRSRHVRSQNPGCELTVHTASNPPTGRRGHPSLGLTDRMRHSYDSARAAYELAAVSPSTSSNSSNSLELLPDRPLTSSCFPSPTTHNTDVVPRSVSHRNEACDTERQRCEDSGQRCEDSGPLVSDRLYSSRSHRPRSLSISCDNINGPSSSSTYPASDDLYSSTSPPPPPPRPHPAHHHQPHPQSSRVKQTSETRPHRNHSQYSSTNATTTSSPLHRGSTDICDGGESGPPKPLDHQDNTTQGSSGYRPSNTNHRPVQDSPFLASQASTHGSPGTSKGSSTSSDGGGPLPPSPPLVVGQMRRSHSAISQVSAFSVCSETGEKKLKTRQQDGDPEPLTADCQYPPHPRRLSQHKHHPPPIGTHRTAHQYPQETRNPGIVKTTYPMNRPMSRSFPAPNGPMGCDPDLQPATLTVPISKKVTAHSTFGYANSRAPDTGSRSKAVRCDDPRKDSHKDHLPKDGIAFAYAPPHSHSAGSSSTAHNIAPLSPPFVTFQSGKFVSEGLFADRRELKHPLEDAACRDGTEECKKARKKRDKEKRYSLPFKHKEVPSPSYGGKGEVKAKHDVPTAKKQTRSSSKSGRKVDKKRVSGFPHQPSLVDTGVPCFDDSSPCYGNADVYRSLASDVSFTPPLPVLSPPFHKSADHHANRSQLVSKESSGKDAKHNSVCPTTVKLGHDFVNGSYFPPSVLSPTQSTFLPKDPSPQTRRKSSHRRPPSTGHKNLNGHCPPSQAHTRPKSYAGKAQITKLQDSDPASVETTGFDSMAPSGGKRVKSGFGHDLALDDQMGGINSVTADRTSLMRPSVTSLTQKFQRTDGGPNSNSHSIDKRDNSETTPTAPPPPSRRRSGLSQDLSLVHRSEITPTKRINKQSSLPACLSSSSNPPHKYVGNSVVLKNGYTDPPNVWARHEDSGVYRNGLVGGDMAPCLTSRQAKTYRDTAVAANHRHSVEDNDFVATSYV